MDTLTDLVPAKYAALIVACKMLLDALIFAIPDKWLAAHSTEQAIVNALKKLLRPGAAAFLLLVLPSCGHAAQAAGGTFATVAAAEHAYTKWAVSEVDRLSAKARSECHDAACIERITGPTFSTLDKVEAARDAYHAAQRAAARCLQAGGEPVACTLAVAGEGGRLVEKLDAVGFKVLP